MPLGTGKSSLSKCKLWYLTLQQVRPFEQYLPALHRQRSSNETCSGSFLTGQDFSKGDYVWYLTQHGHYVEAAIAAVDNTVSPRSYTVSFAADPSTYRETEAIRLRPATALQDGQFDTLGCECPALGCQAIISANELQVEPANAFNVLTQKPI